MIQRIQTVYLLIVAALNLAVVFLPLAVIQSGKTFYVFGACILLCLLSLVSN